MIFGETVILQTINELLYKYIHQSALIMKLCELLHSDHVTLDIKENSREAVIKTLIGMLSATRSIQDSESILKLVVARENDVGTGIGYGVAIPHAEPGPYPKPLVAFGRLSKGLDFHAPDKQKAKLIFLLLTPDKTPALHVRLLARICRLLKSDQLRKDLLEVEDVKSATEIFAKAEEDFPELNP